MSSRLATFGTLRLRLFLLVLLVLAPAFGLVWYGNSEQERMERRTARLNAEITARLAATSQEYFIKHSKYLLETLTQFSFLTLATNREFCEWHMANLQLLQPEYADFGIVDIDGKLFCTALKKWEQVSLAENAMFQRVRQFDRFALGDFEMDPISGQQILRCGIPVKDTNGVTSRVLYASLRLPLLSEALAELPLPRGGVSMVLDPLGTVLARHPDPERWVGQQVSSEPYIQAAMGGSASGSDSEVGLDGIYRVVASQRVSDGAADSFFVVVEAPRRLLFASVQEILTRNLWLMVLAGVLAVGIAWFYTERVVLRPVRSIHDAALRLGQGDLSARTEVKSGGTEVHQLAAIFDEMAEKLARRTAELQEAHDSLESRVQRRTADLAAANKELEAFSYSVSHDLRAPVRHIDGFTKILLEEKPVQSDPEIRQYVTAISNAAQRMGTLIEGLLTLSKAGRQSLAISEVDFCVLLQEMVEELHPEQNGRVVRWAVSAMPKSVHCDLSLMRQVWANLLSNALKYTRNRAEAVIEVSYSEERGEHLFSVRDNGAGFDMAYAERLFGVFQRLHLDSEFEGTGVGLAIVQRIIVRHHGRIWAEGRVNEGATFYFSIPKDPA